MTDLSPKHPSMGYKQYRCAVTNNQIEDSACYTYYKADRYGTSEYHYHYSKDEFKEIVKDEGCSTHPSTFIFFGIFFLILGFVAIYRIITIKL